MDDDLPALRDLVDAARRGDVDAQGRLFDRYHRAIYRYAYVRLRSVADAEDVVADTFVSAIQAIPRFRWRGVPFEAWLFRVAGSKVTDRLRRRARADAANVVDLGDHLTEVADATVMADPVAAAERAEREAALARALDRLPLTQRDVIVMRFLLGRSTRDVATAMRRSDGAVKQLQARGLARLREELDR